MNQNDNKNKKQEEISRKSCLKKLIKDIYGAKTVNYTLTSSENVDGYEKRRYLITRGTAGKGLIDELEFTPYYSKALIELFKLTFDDYEGVNVVFDKKKKNFDQLHCIANYCKLVGLETVEVLDLEYNYAYRYTEDSPFKVMNSFYKYAPHDEIVVCCDKSQMPDKTPTIQESEANKITILEFLEKNEVYREDMSKIICSYLCNQFIPLLFDSYCFYAYKYDYYFEERVKSICDSSFNALNSVYNKYIIDSRYSHHIYSYPTVVNNYIILLDREHDKLDGKNSFDLDCILEWYAIDKDLFPPHITIPTLKYKSHYASPKIIVSGIITNNNNTNSNITFPIVTNYLLFYKMNVDSEKMNSYNKLKKPVYNNIIEFFNNKQSMIYEEELKKLASENRRSYSEVIELVHDRLKQDYIEHYKQNMKCIEKLIEIVYSFDFEVLIDETAVNEEMLKLFYGFAEESCLDYLAEVNRKIELLREKTNTPWKKEERKLNNEYIEHRKNLSSNIKLASDLPRVINEELSNIGNLYYRIKNLQSPDPVIEEPNGKQQFSATELSVALLQWIGDVGDAIERFTRELPKSYVNGIEIDYLKEHCKKIKQYAVSKLLMNAIDEMNNAFENMDRKNENKKYDEWELCCWDNLRKNHGNVFEKIKTSLEAYLNKVKALIIEF